MRLFLIAALAVLLPLTARAEPVAYHFDNPHTQILFFINHMGFSNSAGKFLEYDGTILFDSENPEESSVDITIPVASLDMGDETWNEHVTGEDYLNAAEYPEMTFRSTAIEVTGEKTADITGDLTLHGVTKPVVLKTVLNKVGPNPMSKKDQAGFSATTTIKRSDFGIDQSIPLVGDEVDIRIEVEAVKGAKAEDETDSE